MSLSFTRPPDALIYFWNLSVPVCHVYVVTFDLSADYTVKDKSSTELCLSKQNKLQGNFYLNVIGNLLE